MAVTRTAKSTATSKTSGTTLSLSVSMTAGDLLVVSLAYDDQTLNSVTWNGQTLTLGDAVLGAGVRTRLAWVVASATATANVTATWAAAITAKAMTASSYNCSTGGVVLNEDTNQTNTGTGTAASTSALGAIHGGTDSILVGVVGTEGPSGDTAGTWSTPSTNGQRAGTTGNPAAGNVTVSEAYQLAPTASSTPALSKTGMTSRDWGAALRAFYWGAPPAQTLTLGLLDGAPALYAPALSYTQSINLGFLDAGPSLFAPTLSQSGGGGGNPAFVKEVATYATGVSSITHDIAVTNAPSVGNHLILKAVIAGGRNITGVTDTAGNTWQVDHNIQNGTNHSVGLASCKVTNALTTSDVITVTYSATNVVAAVVAEYSGLDPTSWFDQATSHTATVADATVASGSTGTSAVANSLIIGVEGDGTRTTTPETLSPAWNALSVMSTTGTVRNVAPFYRVVSSTGTFAFNGTLSSTNVHTDVVAIYKGGGGSGAQTLTLGLLDGAPALYAPTLTPKNSIDLGLLDASPTLYAPTLTPKNSISLGLLDAGPALYAPTVTPGPVGITLGLLDAGPALFAPTLAAKNTVALSLLDAAPALFAPTIAPAPYPITLPLLDAGPALYAPTVAQSGGPQDITLGLLDAGPTLYAPTLTPTNTVTLGLLDAGPTLYAPTLTPKNTVSLGLLDAGPALYAPTLVGKNAISLGLLDGAPALYAPTLTLAPYPITLPLLDAGPALYAPTVQQASGTQDVTLPLLDAGPALYAPTLVGKNLVTLPLLDAGPTLYAPTLLPTVTITLGLLDGGPQLYAPTFTVGAVTVTLPLLDAGRALYPPTIAGATYTIAGVTRTPDGTPLGNCVVHLFRTADDVEVDQTTSSVLGAFSFNVADNTTEHYIVAYKAGTVDKAGTTVNTLVGST